ncbi:hypothetical protein FQ187_28845, partial [Pseudomonas sp. ANT_J28]
DHLYNFQLEAVVEYFAFVGHGELLNRCIFHLSGCPGKLDHCSHDRDRLHRFHLRRGVPVVRVGRDGAGAGDRERGR